METKTNLTAPEELGKNVVSSVQKCHEFHKKEIEKHFNRVLKDNIAALEFIVAEYRFLQALKAIKVEK